jgi:hypothetical protein
MLRSEDGDFGFFCEFEGRLYAGVREKGLSILAESTRRGAAAE